MLRIILIKLGLKLVAIKKRFTRPVRVLPIARFYEKHFSGQKPDKDYFSSRSYPHFFFDHSQVDSIRQVYRRQFQKEYERIISRADKVLRHKFDLLGSGEVELGKKIDWHKDFKSGLRWPKVHYTRIKTVDLNNSADIKVPWELSRLQHFSLLGRAYCLTDDTSYLREFIATIEDWEIENPVDVGVNWTCPMEVAIRAINIIWGLYFFSVNGALEQSFVQKTIRLLYYHARHIEKNLEVVGSGANSNHLLTNYLGLFYIGQFFPQFDRSSQWRLMGLNGLEKEILEQVFEDGADYECSTSYHRLVLEIFLSAHILTGKNDFQFSAEYIDRLKNMLRFSETITPPSGMVPLFGDNDNGFIITLSHNDPASHAHLLELGAVAFEREAVAFTEETLWYFGANFIKPVLPKNRVRSRFFLQSGYAVIRDESFHLVFAATSIAKCHLAGHKHNDNLSFTLEIDGIPFLVDPGSYCYTSDYKMRNKNRSIVSHNTVAVDGQEQNRYYVRKLFYLLNDAKAKIDLWINTKDSIVVSGVHSGYSRLGDRIVHRRTIWADPPRKSIRVLDEFDGITRDEHLFETRFVTPVAQVVVAKNNRITIQEKVDCGISMNFESDVSGDWLIEGCEIYPRYGVSMPAKIITMRQRTKVPLKNVTVISAISGWPADSVQWSQKDDRVFAIKDTMQSVCR